MLRIHLVIIGRQFVPGQWMQALIENVNCPYLALLTVLDVIADRQRDAFDGVAQIRLAHGRIVHVNGRAGVEFSGETPTSGPGCVGRCSCKTSKITAVVVNPYMHTLSQSKAVLRLPLGGKNMSEVMSFIRNRSINQSINQLIEQTNHQTVIQSSLFVFQFSLTILKLFRSSFFIDQQSPSTFPYNATNLDFPLHIGYVAFAPVIPAARF